LIITFVLEKNAIFFAENWQKSQEIVIITSTPGPYLILNDQGQHGPVPLGEALGDDPGHAVVGKPYNASVSVCDHSVSRHPRPDVQFIFCSRLASRLEQGCQMVCFQNLGKFWWVLQ
jgi:hypothetical protein